MKHRHHQPLALSLAIAAALLPTALWAQAQTGEEAQPERTKAGKQEELAQTLDTIVVSGSAQSRGLRKSQASFSITTATPEQIDDAAPSSTADLLKVVPGVWVEATGGVSGANIDVRGFPGGGDAPFVTMQLDGSPIFPPPTLSFLENSTLFRLDETVDHVEVLRGGPSPVFSNGQPGATVNFIQKRGGPTPEGEARFTAGSHGLYRFDGYYGGAIAEDWYFSVGGFYREDDGVRDTQFLANKGGQLSATLTHVFDNGEFTLYGRHTDDNNAFFTGVPLISRKGGKDISAFPGFDPTEDTLIGRDFRRVDLQVTPGAEPGTISRDLADGRGVLLNLFGATFDAEYAGWTVSNRANFLDGFAPTNGLFTGANPQTLDSFIADSIAAANANPAVLAAAGAPATSGTATFVNGGGAVSGSQQVMSAGFWVVDKDLKSFTDEVRVSRELFEDNTVTVGAYYADYSSNDRWFLGNGMLLTAEPNARRVDVALNNGAAVTREGFNGAAFFAVNAEYDGDNIAGFIADEWEVTERLRLDAGFRLERQSVDAVLENITSTDLDSNPLTLSNNNATVFTGTFRKIDFEETETSWTAGANYLLRPDTSVFARINTGYAFPQFDNLRDGQDQIKEIDQYEIGLKQATSLYSVFLTAFYAEFEGLSFQQFDLEGNNITRIGGSRSFGLEFEGQIRPTENFDVHITGNWMDAEYRDFGGNTDNRVNRQPKVQFRLTPSYVVPIGDYNSVRLFATWTHVGDRFSDVENLQPLPSYDTLDFGVAANLGDHWELRVQGTNVTDELALTEGNARVIGSGTTGGVFLGRPLEGRNIFTSLTYRF